MRITRKDAKFFRDSNAFRAWLAKNGATAKALWVGYWKKTSGKKGISYEEAVRAALSYGWIDGHGMGIDAESHANRYTPRKPGSIWSVSNLKRIKELKKAGLMRKAGIAAFENRDKKKTGLYSFEQGTVNLDAATERTIRKHPAAWKFFRAQAPSYQRVATWWIISAKKPETKTSRITALIRDSEAGRRLKQFVSPKRPT